MPIQELCARLVILRIEDLDTGGFEGGLMTHSKRSEGTILAKRGSDPVAASPSCMSSATNLMAHHLPDQPGQFLCKNFDLLRVTAKAGDQRQRREVDANRFASIMLMPPPLPAGGAVAVFRNPDLQQVLALAYDFGVGREAVARAYV